MLELHDVELPKETEKENKKKSKVCIKKSLNRNRDFRHVTNNVVKGKRLGLRSTQDEDGIMHHDKEKNRTKSKEP